MRETADREWYTKISQEKSLSPRCPFASVHRCPRYWASVSMLGKVGIATEIDADEDKMLEKFWKHSGLLPATSEFDTGVSSVEGTPKSFNNFCPEVTFEIFGFFASYLARYVDEIDLEGAHARLEKEGAGRDDWRWNWWMLRPLHFSDCPLYSLLPVNPGIRSSVSAHYPPGSPEGDDLRRTRSNLELSKIQELVTSWVYRRCGAAGLAGLALFVLAFLGWWHWDHIRSLPGVSLLLSLLRQGVNILSNAIRR